MKRILGLSTILIVAMSIGVAAQKAQDKPSVPIKGDHEIRANIRELQLQQQALISVFNGCRETLRTAPIESDALVGRIRTQVSLAFARAKLSQEEFDLNLETFEFTKRPVLKEPTVDKKP